MNPIYRSVWNGVTRTCVAAAEIVRDKGSKSRCAEGSAAILDGSTPAGSTREQPTARPAPLQFGGFRSMALEQRFMFDGAAVADAVDAVSQPVSKDVIQDGGLLNFATSAETTAALNAAQQQAERIVADYLQKPDATQQLFTLFNGGQQEPSAHWQQAANDLIAAVRDNNLSVRVELGSSAELQGALGAFTAQGPDGQPVIYLNAGYAESASSEALQAVLIEELGHSFDVLLNGTNDSPGDEGHAFASLLLNGQANAMAAGSENDQLTLNIDGRAVSAEAAAPYNIAQTHYVPMAEPDVQTSLKAISTGVTGNIQTVIAISATGNETIVVYDHWEDGYEADINNPVQSSTQIWGDGDLTNGIAPGTTNDIFNAGQTILLNNAVDPASPGTLDFDARDKIGSTKAVSVTKAGWSVTPGTVLAGAVAVIDAGNAGKVYTLPIGQNVETVATGTNKLFEYTSAHIIATQNGTTVTVDYNGNGIFDAGSDLTFTLNEGETRLINGGLNAGAKITADKGIGVYLIAGDVGSAYENRWFALTPDEQWASSYYAPVGTTLAADPSYVLLYNPNASAITVNWDTGAGAQTPITISAKSTGYALMPASAAHFYTANGAKFFAVGLIDADATSNATHDWSYSLVPETYLTTKFVVAWGPGNNNNPVTGATNGSPVWVTTTANTSIYVDSATVTVKDSRGNVVLGDQVGSSNTYEYEVKALESYRLFDADNDQSGLTVYTTDGTLITAAWGEDPSIAGAGNPYLDMGTTVLPFPDYVFTKDSSEAKTITYGTGVSNDNTQVELGEEIEYTINLTNRAVIDLYNINIRDQITPDAAATYVANSTRITIVRADGTVLVNNALIPDATDATPFPLLRADGGYTVTDIDPSTGTVDGLKRGDKITITYRVRVGSDSATLAALATNGFAVTNDADMSGNAASTPIKFATNKTIINASGTADGQVFFKDAAFTATKSAFAESDTLGLEVIDADANLNTGTPDTVTVTVTNITTGETEQVTLTETGNSTGIFRNTLATSPTAGATSDSGILQLRQGDSLKVDYTDPVFGPAFDNPTNPGVAGDADNNIATGNPNTANAGVPVPSQTKILYFSDDSANNLDRVMPTDGSAASTALINASAASTAVTITDNFGTGSTYSAATGSNWVGNWIQNDGTTSFSTGSGNVRVADLDSNNAAYNWAMYLRTPGVGISRNFAALGSSATLTFDLKDTSRAYEDTDYVSVQQYIGGAWSEIGKAFGTTINATSFTTQTFTLSAGASGLRFVSFDATGDNSDRVYIDNVKIVSGYVSTSSSTGATDYPISAAAPAGQTFSFSGSGSTADAINVNGLSLSLKKTGSTSATATVSIRNAWDGTVLWSGTVSTASLTTSYQDIALNVSGLTLDKGATYVLRVDSNNSGIVWQGGTADSYASGTRLNSSGVSASGDMRFALSGQESLLSSVTFTQGLTMATDFTLPVGGVIKVVTHVTNATNLADGQAITATLSANGTGFASATTPDYDAVAGTLTWTFAPLGSAKTITAGQAVKLVIQNNQSTTSFKIAYDSAATPSRIELPTTTVISIQDADPVTAGVQEVGFFDKSFDNGGSPVTAGFIDAGGIVYVRVKVADPFGDYDISSLNLTIDGPDAGGDITLNMGDAYVVDAASDGRAYKTYEYAWQTVYNLGSYALRVVANEGAEGTVSDSAGASLLVQARDLGTPSTTMFLNSLGGAEAGALYDRGSNRAYLRVTDMDKSNRGSLTVTVNGYTVTLTETATQGVFEADLGSTAVHAGDATAQTAAAAYFTNMPNGTVLNASYTDPDDGSDSSADSIGINANPDAIDNSLSIGMDQQASGNVITDDNGSGADTDPNGQTLSVTAVNGNTANVGDIITLASGARLLVNSDGSYIYDPSTLTSPPTSGSPTATDTFTYTVSDGKGGTDTATVTLSITYVNPAVIDNQADTDGATVEFDVSNKFSSINSVATVEYTATGLPTGLSIDINTGIISGNIASGASTASGTNTFNVSVTASDVDNVAADVTRSFTWTVTNVAPLAVNDSNSTSINVPVSGNVISNDSDGAPDSDTMTVSKINGADYTLDTNIATAHGTVKITNASGAYTYTPTAGYAGADSFTYTISDGNGGTSTATVNLSIIGVNDITVNEGSPYAVFTVTGVEGQQVKLSLASGTATIENGNGTVLTDGSEDFGPALQYWNGSTWTGYTAGDFITLPSDGDGTSGETARLLVRTAINPDTLDEGNHSFTLKAENTGGTFDTGTATIDDHGGGVKYPDVAPTNPTSTDPAPVTETTDLDDDRALTVNDITVNEGSPYAVFTVAGAPDQLVSLTLTDGTAKIDADGAPLNDGSEDYGPTIECSKDNGATWHTYVPGSTTLDGSGKLLVRTQIVNDILYEGSHTFTLTATNASGVADAGLATIRDDGTGDIFSNDGSVNSAASRNDDRPTLSINNVTVEEGSRAVFTVSLDKASDSTLQVAFTVSAGTDLVGDTLTAQASDVDPANLVVTYVDGNGNTQTLIATAGKYTIPAGVKTLTVKVPTTSDDVYEGTETFTLTAAVTETFVTVSGPGTATIVDDGSLDGDDSGEDADNDKPTPQSPEAPAPTAPSAPDAPAVPPAEPVSTPVDAFNSAMVITPSGLPSVFDSSLITIYDVMTESSGFKVVVQPADGSRLSLFRGIADQFVEGGEAASFALPHDTFVHTRADVTVTLAAKTADGKTLPSWVQFDAQSGTFKLQPPKDFKGELRIKVIARDSDGQEASALFRLHVGDGKVGSGRISLSEQLRLAQRPTPWLDLVRAQDNSRMKRETAARVAA